MVVRKTMRIVSDVSTQQEFNEMKTVMEIFVVKTRVRQLAEMA